MRVTEFTGLRVTTRFCRRPATGDTRDRSISKLASDATPSVSFGSLLTFSETVTSSSLKSARDLYSHDRLWNLRLHFVVAQVPANRVVGPDHPGLVPSAVSHSDVDRHKIVHDPKYLCRNSTCSRRLLSYSLLARWAPVGILDSCVLCRRYVDGLPKKQEHPSREDSAGGDVAHGRRTGCIWCS